MDFKILAVYQFLRVAIETGIIHYDLHFGNIFIVEDYNFYLENMKEKAIIIDWGKYIKLEEEEKINCQRLFSQIQNKKNDEEAIKNWMAIIAIIAIDKDGKHRLDVTQLKWLRKLAGSGQIIANRLENLNTSRNNQIITNQGKFKLKNIKVPKINHYKDAFLPIKDEVIVETPPPPGRAILGGSKKIRNVKKSTKKTGN